MKTIVLLLFTSIMFSQNSFVAAGNNNETFGEVFPIIQQVDTIVNEVSLGIPTFEIPEQPKPIIKKKSKSFLEQLIEFIKKLINKKQ